MTLLVNRLKKTLFNRFFPNTSLPLRFYALKMMLKHTLFHIDHGWNLER